MLGHDDVLVAWARRGQERLEAKAAEGFEVIGPSERGNRRQAVELHVLDAPIDVLLERFQRRNRESPPITRDELLQWAQLFEMPAPEEIALFDSPCVAGSV